MLISNKPNIRGIRKVAADVKYRAALIGRDQRLFCRTHSHQNLWYGFGFHTGSSSGRSSRIMGIMTYGGIINGRRR